ncbi:MAG: 2-oxo acid dehydrogenase subunit E2 [Deltaproteobacteria bacterium]|nr:2-oxo acid dehydrogenase subunit E2 [Deltaproteobacteria bacterium]
MIKDIIIPNLGLTMTKAKIAKWTQEEGAEVKKGEVVLIIETDKVSYDIEAPLSGHLHLIGQPGQTHPVTAVVGWVAETKQEYEAKKGEDVVPVPKKAAPPAEAAAPKAKPAAAAAKKKKRAVSPVARKLAQQHNLDLSAISGTGPGGRIVKEDVLQALAGAEAAPAPQAAAGLDELKKVKEVVPLSGLREVIATHLHRSLQDTAQLTITMEVEAGEFVRFRQVLAESMTDQGVRISYNAVLVKVLALALKQHPRFNASADDEQITLWESINLGVAMETPEGLVVPVIHDADSRDLVAIQKKLDDLVDKARSKKLALEEIKGGTFTLSNLGFLDVEAFTPIINQPEVGILGVGKILEKAVVVEGQIKIGQRMMLSLTFDHRVVDGTDAARFLKTVKSYLEEPHLIYAAQLGGGS